MWVFDHTAVVHTVFSLVRFHFEGGKMIANLEQVRFPTGRFLQFV